MRGEESPALKSTYRAATDMSVRGQGYPGGAKRKSEELEVDRDRLSSAEMENSQDGESAELTLGGNVKHFDLGNILQSRKPKEALRGSTNAG